MSTHDPRDLRAHERTEDERARREALVRDQQADDLRWLMSHKQGRRVMARILEQSGVEQISFTGNSQTFFNEGARSVGVPLLNEVKHNAWDHYITMLEETRK